MPIVQLNNQEWKQLSDLSTSAKKMVHYAAGWRPHRVHFVPLDSDPAHPFTDGALEFHTANYHNGVANEDWALLKSGGFADPSVLHGKLAQIGIFDQGGIHLDGHRLPLHMTLKARRFTTDADVFDYKLEIVVARQDGVAIDDTEKAAQSLTLDIDTGDSNAAVTVNGGTGAADTAIAGAYKMIWDISQAQWDALRVGTKEKSVSFDLSAAVPKLKSYSAYDDEQPDPWDSELSLALGESVAVQAPASGAMYARTTSPYGAEIYVGA